MSTTTTRNVVSFRVGSQWYAIDVDQVSEILHLVMLNEPTTSKADVLGLITVRNVVMPVIDLRLRFGIPDPQYHLDTPIITIQTQRGPMGIVVDDIDNIEPISETQITATVRDEFPYVSGMTQVRDQSLMLLNLAAIFGSGEPMP